MKENCKKNYLAPTLQTVVLENSEDVVRTSALTDEKGGAWKSEWNMFDRPEGLE